MRRDVGGWAHGLGATTVQMSTFLLARRALNSPNPPSPRLVTTPSLPPTSFPGWAMIA